MSAPTSPSLFSEGFQHRVLIVDDEPMIQFSLKMILESVAEESSGQVFENEDQSRTTSLQKYLIKCFSCGEEAMETVRQAEETGAPFSLAFVDLNLNGHWRGTRAIQELWKISPELHVVICSVLEDSTWKDVVDELGFTDQMLILKKPFDRAEVLQLACALTRKWELGHQARWNLEHLQELVEARSEQLTQLNIHLRKTNSQLEIARDQAFAANQAKNEFLANVSHEFQTPMTAILGFTEILGEQLADEFSRNTEAANFLTTIHRNASHLVSLMNDVLNLTRLETNDLKVDKKEVEVTAILGEVLESAHQKAFAKNLNFQIELAPDLPITVFTDAYYVQEILRHLLENAVKFSEEGEIRFQAELKKGDWLRIEVTDTGVGIPAETMGSLTQSFTQLDASLSRNYGGLGIGLSLCRQLAELLGGKLSGSSSVNQGTKIILELPARNAEPSKLVPLDIQPTTRPPADHFRFAAKILLVEGVPVVHRVMQFHLKSMGVQVVLATSHEQAVEFSKLAITNNDPFDLILWDLNIEGTIAETEIVHVRQAGFGNPIIGLLDPTTTIHVQQPSYPACNAYLPKPARKLDLLNCLVEHCPHLITDSSTISSTRTDQSRN